MDDLISRQAAIDALNELMIYRPLDSDKYVISDCLNKIVGLPSADVQPVQHGHWINHPDDLFPEDSMIECSVCHEYEYATANDNFCGNCGARMDEAE